MEIYTPFQKIVLSHAERYPGWLAPDLYKLIHQATLGSGHAVTSAENARAWLEEDLAGLGENREEPLLDPIAPDGAIVRVHLRPLVRSGLAVDLLLEAFIKTANNYRGEVTNLRACLLQAVELAEHDLIHIRLHDLTHYLGLVSSASFPAVHHTDEYRQAYQPAYRVVLREYLPAEWG